MILKVLALIAVIVIVYKLIDIISKKNQNLKVSQDKKERVEESTFIECAKCGTYVDRDEAIATTTGYVCSKECLEGSR